MNKRDVRTREDLELYYNRCRKIKFADEIKPKDIIEIFKLIKYKNDSKATYFKTGTLHCDINKYRSIDDYIKLCKFYFPETTLKDIIETISHFTLNRDDNGFYTRIDWCPNIRKDNCRYSYYFLDSSNENFKNRSLVDQGFPNCQIKYKTILEWE